MHEVGLMQDALGLALEEARRQGASRVHQLTLRVGRLAGVEPEALAFAFAPPAQLDDHGRNRLPGHGFTLHACYLHPRSRGEIRLRSARPPVT